MIINNMVVIKDDNHSIRSLLFISNILTLSYELIINNKEILALIERRKKVLEFLSNHEKATVKDLSSFSNVTEVTMRNDLKIMEKNGLVKRFHGGAILSAQMDPENFFTVREQRNQKQKAAIAKKAVALVANGQCILLDGSSTIREFAKLLKTMPVRLTVITNGIYTALELRDNPLITVILLSGVIRVGSTALEGALGVNILNQLKIDIMFTSASGFTLKDGLMDFNVYEVDLKKRMVQSSARLVTLMDASKFNTSSLASFAAIDQMETLITDSAAPEDIIAHLRDMNINVVFG